MKIFHIYNLGFCRRYVFNTFKFPLIPGHFYLWNFLKRLMHCVISEVKIICRTSSKTLPTIMSFIFFLPIQNISSPLWDGMHFHLQFTRSAFAAALVQSCKRRVCKLGVMHCRPASRPNRTCSISVCKADVTDQFKESRDGKQNV